MKVCNHHRHPKGWTPNDREAGSVGFCRKLLAQLHEAKRAILNEFSEVLADCHNEAHGHLLHLALNEAEALAWQSGVPHLVFPTLAREKVEAVATWHARQKSIYENGPALAFAA